MELGLYVGRGEPITIRERTDSTSRELSSMSSGDNAMSEMNPNSHQPSLQLELKLSWSKEQQENCSTANNGIQNINGNIHDSRDIITSTPSESHVIEAPESRRIRWRSSDDEEIIGQMPRKKLRLTKEQSFYLEESFKEHSTLNPKQKLAISKKLNLRPRQVEVWFQNRRARTKLKQTEVDFECLKRCCESLTEENRRLHRELHELRAIKSPMPQFRLLQSPAVATLRLCPSCERATATDGGGRGQRLFDGFGINSNKEAECNKLAYQVG